MDRLKAFEPDQAKRSGEVPVSSLYISPNLARQRAHSRAHAARAQHAGWSGVVFDCIPRMMLASCHIFRSCSIIAVPSFSMAAANAGLLMINPIVGY